MGVPKTRTGELPSVKKPRTFQKHLQLQVERSTCRRDSHNVVRSSAPRWAALTPELSQPRAGLRVRVSVQQSLARCLAQAYPLILEGGRGTQRSPWGMDTGDCLDPGAGSAFRSPSSSLALGPSPSLTHQPVGTRTEMLLATRPHTPKPQPPLDSALPT